MEQCQAGNFDQYLITAAASFVARPHTSTSTAVQLLRSGLTPHVKNRVSISSVPACTAHMKALMSLSEGSRKS